MSNLNTLPNLGKVTQEALQKIGINTAEEFLARDPYEIFHELLLKVDPTLCRSFLAGLVGASVSKKWNLVSREAAAEYSKRYPEHKWCI
jgi:hypothetical protein